MICDWRLIWRHVTLRNYPFGLARRSFWSFVAGDFGVCEIHSVNQQKWQQIFRTFLQHFRRVSKLFGTILRRVKTFR